MDYEQKYREAYVRASLRFGENVANELFLEYKESKEERIRRELIEFFSDWSKTKSHCWGIRVTDIMDWLEKQGQKPFNYECANIPQKDFSPAIGIEIPFGAKDSELQEATYLIPEGFHAEIEDNEVLIKKGKQKPAEWHIEDEQNLNACLGYIPDEFLRSWLTNIINIKDNKPVWSEEDEGFLNLLLAIFTNEHPNGVFTTDNITVFKGNCVTSNRIITWLKSLKQRIGG